MSFAELHRSIYGARALAAEYADRGVTENPLYRAGVERLSAELVLALGLVHHLVLGEGRTLESVLETLARLSTRTLVLEFVSLDDEKIRGEPGFFRNLQKSNASSYNLERAMEIGRRYFHSVSIRPSHPASRTMLVFDK
jgi:hypothetical protein